MEKLLQVKNLKTQFSTDEGIARAVDGISFDIYPGETVGLVGESGSGKTVTALSIMGLHTGKVTEGEILFHGKDLLRLSHRDMQNIRGGEIGMIFQDPMTSLDPVFTVGFQLREAIRRHRNVSSKDEATKLAIKALRDVGIPQPEVRINNYPHQLSGGMRQRVSIAMAVVCGAELLIADEITTALDMTIQAQILELLREDQRQRGNSILMITHDLGVVAEMCDRVMVMYCGRIVESGTTDQIFHDPQHWYTKGLLSSIPKIDQKVDRLTTIEGVVPSITNLPDGCRFHPRCPAACEKCRTGTPSMVECGLSHYSACVLASSLPSDSAR